LRPARRTPAGQLFACRTVDAMCGGEIKSPGRLFLSFFSTPSPGGPGQPQLGGGTAPAPAAPKLRTNLHALSTVPTRSKTNHDMYHPRSLPATAILHTVTASATASSRDAVHASLRRREYGKRPRASSYPLHSSLPSLDPFPSPGYQFRRRGSSIGPRSGLIWGHPSARSDSWAPPTHLGALGFRGRGSVCLLCSDLGGLPRGCRVRDRAVAWGRDGIANSSVGRVDPPNSFGRVNQQPVLTPITPRALCDCWRGSVHVCRLSTNAECRVFL
jgi:hypothetical protein